MPQTHLLGLPLLTAGQAGVGHRKSANAKSVASCTVGCTEANTPPERDWFSLVEAGSWVVRERGVEGLLTFRPARLRPSPGTALDPWETGPNPRGDNRAPHWPSSCS